MIQILLPDKWVAKLLGMMLLKLRMRMHWSSLRFEKEKKKD